MVYFIVIRWNNIQRANQKPSAVKLLIVDCTNYLRIWSTASILLTSNVCQSKKNFKADIHNIKHKLSKLYLFPSIHRKKMIHIKIF